MTKLVARADPTSQAFIPGLMLPSSDTISSATLSPSSTATSTSTAAANPSSNIRHNVPLLLCIVIGGVVVTATLLVSLAWLLRLTCCAGERRARRKRKLDRATWNPSNTIHEQLGDLPEGGKSFDNVTVNDDDDLEGKDAKIDALFQDTTKDIRVSQNVPVLTYNNAEAASEAPKSMWNGKGWSLFDPPVAALQLPKPAARGGAGGGGDYGAAKEELADRDVEGFTWPSSVKRQPSFIERLVQRQHQASHLPTTAPLPYPFQAKPPQPASRMASLGGAANRAVMNMLPVTLRVAATTASRQRATRKRYNDMQPYLDSDFEGTIGCKDRELPMARRLRHAEDRMAVDWTTEEEGGASPLVDLPAGQPAFGMHAITRVQPAMISSPLANMTGKAPIEFTPGLAGVGAAWSKVGPQQSSLANTRVPIVAGPSLVTSRPTRAIEPKNTSLLPVPTTNEDRRSRLLGNVGRWLGHVTEADEFADPYTALTPRPDHRVTKNGSLRSDCTSTTLADTNSDTHVDARTSMTGASKSERLLERVDADQAEHDRQQRRLLRKARQFTPAVDPAPRDVAQADDASANVSRAPSIRPQFFATTDLTSWLEPAKVSTTHGFKVLEEKDAASSVAADPFASDVESRKPRLRKYESYDSLSSQTRRSKPKRRSSSSRHPRRAATPVKIRTRTQLVCRQKQEAPRSVNPATAANVSKAMIPTNTQSSAAVTIMSSVFDEAFAARLGTGAKTNAKAEADAAVTDAWNRRRMLSISSREGGKPELLLKREESIMSQPSIYSELTAPSDYAFRAPLLSNSKRGVPLPNSAVSKVQVVSAEADAKPVAVLQREQDAARRQELKQAKKVAKLEQRRAERQQAGRVSSAFPSYTEEPSRDPRGSGPMDRTRADNVEAVRRMIRKQRSISLGTVRKTMQSADVDTISSVPDSPWTSSDSDISVRRWGDARRDDSLRLPGRGLQQTLRSVPVKTTASAAEGKRLKPNHGRSASHFYGMDARDFR